MFPNYIFFLDFPPGKKKNSPAFSLKRAFYTALLLSIHLSITLSTYLFSL